MLFISLVLRKDTAFRLLLHDTTFRWWKREPRKLTYEGLLLQKHLPLSEGHIDLLRTLIARGDRRPTSTIGDGNLNDQYERDTDQELAQHHDPPTHAENTPCPANKPFSCAPASFAVHRTLI